MGLFGGSKSRSNSVAPDNCETTSATTEETTETTTTTKTTQEEPIPESTPTEIPTEEMAVDKEEKSEFALPVRTTPFSKVTVTRPELARKQNIYTRQLKEPVTEGIILKLPRGGSIVTTKAGDIQFGIPPETIKVSISFVFVCYVCWEGVVF